MLIIDSCVFIDHFEPESHNHGPSSKLLEELSARKLLITMPAHAWFEIQVTLRLLTREKRFKGRPIGGNFYYPLELIYIDDAFLEKYVNVEVPYIRAGDHIFLVVAKHNGCPLVTNDQQMLDRAKECGINAFNPTEYLNELNQNT